MKIQAGERYSTNRSGNQITVEALEETPDGWRVRVEFSGETITVKAGRLRLAEDDEPTIDVGMGRI